MKPIWIALVIVFAGYIAFGQGACERSDRAVMPIHWAGQGVGYVLANFSTNPQSTPTKNLGDGIASWLRDFIVVASVGTATCEKFSGASETTPPAKPAVKPETFNAQDLEIFNSGRPVFPNAKHN